MQTPAIEAEISALAQRYGAPTIHNVVLQGNPFDPIGKPDRYGEVCMVVRRPNGKLLTAIKTFYPRGAHRLLTGGIHHGEHILDALLRETGEETSLTVEVRRFLTIVHYRYQDDPADEPARFSTFAFLLDETGGVLCSADPDEQLDEFREVAVNDLPAIAGFLSQLAPEPSGHIGGRWNDWGSFSCGNPQRRLPSTHRGWHWISSISGSIQRCSTPCSIRHTSLAHT